MENYKLLKSSKKRLPHGYRLLSVDEALKHNQEVTEFLAFENFKEAIDGFEWKTICEILNHQTPMTSQPTKSEGGGKNNLQEVEESLDNTSTSFLVYEEDKTKNVAGIIKMEFNEKGNIENIPNICNLLQEGGIEKGKRTFSLNRGNGFKKEGALNLEFLEVEMIKEEDDDDEDDYEDDDDEDDDYEEVPTKILESKNEEPKKFKISKSSIDKAIPRGYRLATMRELLLCAGHGTRFLVKRIFFEQDGSTTLGLCLMLRRLAILKEGEKKDIQDFLGTYFKYGTIPEYIHYKIRLKNGFIDQTRGLVWKEFTRHFVSLQLAVRCEHIKIENNIPKVEDQVVALLFACFLGCLDEVNDITKDPNYFEILTKNNVNAPREGCALHLCATEGIVEILNSLMNNLKDPKERNKALTAKADWDEETPLYLATLRAKRKVVKMLCVSENVNQITKQDKYTVLMLAAEYQMENTMLWKPIIECKDLKLNIQNQRKENVFHLVSHYTGVNFNDSSPATLLKELLEKCGCKVSYKAYNALGVENIEKDVIKEVAKLYGENIKHTIDMDNESHCINLTNDRNSTPLHVSLSFREVPTNNLNQDDDIDSSFSSSHVKTIPIQFSRLLISAGADIHATDMQGQNALHHACKFPNDLCTVKILLQCFLSKLSDKPNKLSKHFRDAQLAWTDYTCTQDFLGQTPLHLAAKSGNIGAVHLLLDPTDNILVDSALIDKLIQMRDYSDKTILHFIATRPDPFIVDEEIKLEIQQFIFRPEICKIIALPLLIWSVAEKIGLADKLAKESGYNQLAEVLETTRENSTENLLWLALSLENYEMVVELLNRGAVITKQVHHNAQAENLLNKEQEYWDNKLKLEDNENNNICTKLGKNCLIALYEARKAQVVKKIQKLKKDKNQPNLFQIKDLEKIQESHQGRTTDQPTHEDLLEREDIKSSISALLLNQQMGSPITLGILGGAGMGKSSMMLQVEHNLISRAAKQTVSLALPKSLERPKTRINFTGVKVESNKSKIRAETLLDELQMVIQKIDHKTKPYHIIAEEVIDLQKVQESERHWKCFLKPQYIFKGFLRKVKSLLFVISTCRDRKEAITLSKIDGYISNFDEEHMWLFKRLALANDGQEVPAVLTVRYDAWQYETKDEAWAGLAVEILKEMESCMTKAKLFYASVMYSYKKSPTNLVVQLIIPILLYLIIGGIVGWVSFILLSIPKSPLFASFKYGSIPICILASIWQVLSQVSTYAKPISQKFLESTKSLQVEHLSKQGYQHHVIEDIKFLRDRMTREHVPFLFLWKLGAFIFNIKSGSSFLADKMVASDALKYTPQRENFRIIVFIDNLDRDKEELFTPLNMILKSCDINAVVAIDKGSVDVLDKEDKPAGDKEKEKKSLRNDTLLQQLIQIPIVLPEPDVFELSNVFLARHLKYKVNRTHKETDRTNSHQEDQTDSHQEDRTNSHQEAPINLHEGTSSISQDSRIENFPHEETCHAVDINISKYSKNDSQIETIQPMQNLEGQRNETREIDQSNKTREIDQMNETREIDQMNETGEDRSKESTWLQMNVNVLDSNYSRGEIEVFQHLVMHTYGYYRSPRAWKRMLNYHRLVRSLFTYNSQAIHISAWKRQLIIWVFFCWQWREQMNEIFKNWESLTSFSLKELEYGTLLVSEQQSRDLQKFLKSGSQTRSIKEIRSVRFWDTINLIYPSLLKIIEKYKTNITTQNEIHTKGDEVEIQNAKDDSTSSNSFSSKQMAKYKYIERTKENDIQMDPSSQKHGLKEGESQNMLENQKEEQDKKDEDMHWERLFKPLQFGKYDLTMQAIQVFQKYRFDCEPKTLEMHVVK